MKKILYILFIALFVSSCKESPYFLFNSENRVQLVDSEDLFCSFYYSPETVTDTTILIDVQCIGLMKGVPQKISFEQVTEYYTDYTYDADGAIIDSVVHERKNKGIAGVHYVSLDDASVKDKLVIPANTYTAKIPIVLKRDKSLASGDVRICFKVKQSEDLLLGDMDFISKTIILSVQLPEPTNWAEHVFGEYSKAKHLFMYDVVNLGSPVKIRIDEAWMESITNKGTGIDKQWQKKFITKLDEFNNNPENIASGKAPLRVDQNDPTSALVEF